MSAPTIESVHLAEGQALMSDGSLGRVTEMFGRDGERTEDPDAAVSFVVEAAGRFYAEACEDFMPARTQ